MSLSKSFIEYVLDQLSYCSGVHTRKMFGCMALYRNGEVFAFISDDVIYLKVNEITKEKFILAGSKPFKPFPNRPIIESYYELPIDIIENSEKFIEWIDEALSNNKKK